MILIMAGTLRRSKRRTSFAKDSLPRVSTFSPRHISSSSRLPRQIQLSSSANEVFQVLATKVHLVNSSMTRTKLLFARTSFRLANAVQVIVVICPMNHLLIGLLLVCIFFEVVALTPNAAIPMYGLPLEHRSAGPLRHWDTARRANCARKDTFTSALITQTLAFARKNTVDSLTLTVPGRFERMLLPRKRLMATKNLMLLVKRSTMKSDPMMSTLTTFPMRENSLRERRLVRSRSSKISSASDFLYH